jgi:hypothetical protein
MTVASSTNRSGPYAGDGSNKVFNFAIQTLAAADVKVISTTPVSGVNTDTTLALTTDFSVSLNGDQSASPGGTVTLVVAPPVGTSITVLRNIAMTQSASLPNQGGFYPKVLEAAFDKLTMVVQQMYEEVSRSIKGSAADGTTTVASLAAAAAAATTAGATAAAASATAAAGSASASLASKLLADADVVLTHADVVTTHADVVAAGNSVTAAAASAAAAAASAASINLPPITGTGDAGKAIVVNPAGNAFILSATKSASGRIYMASNFS